MKSLYVTSVERFSGKTAVCLVLGKRLQEDGYKVGYMKPLSLQPWRRAGKIADEDAAFVKEILGLQADPVDLSPVVVTDELLHVHLAGQNGGDLMPRIKAASDQASKGNDVLLLEGGGSLREGYVMGLPTPDVADALKSKVLVVVKYRGEIRLMDDALAAHYRLKDALAGIIINRVPADDIDFVENIAIPYFADKTITVFGILPEVRALAALTVEELRDALSAKVLTKDIVLDGVVENLTVGAMTAEAALSRMRRVRNKAVITGGDRTDIQLAALETSTTCLVLTGNLEPSPLIVKQATELSVPVLLVRENTMETLDEIDLVFGKTRLGQSAKFNLFKELMEQHVDWKPLYDAIGF
jgi:BioD-like phosphotransacetylase family protein